MEVKITDLLDLLMNPETVALGIKKYEDAMAANEKLLNNRPTIVTKGDAKVTQVKVSGNVKLDMGKGEVGNIAIDSDGSQERLSVDVSNYNGNVAVSQKDREDGKWTVTNVKMKNSTVENLTMEGEGNGNVVLAGQNAEVKEAKFDKTPHASLNIKTEAVEVSKEAVDAVINVLHEIEKILIEGSNAKIDVGGCGSIKDASVTGDDVTISGDGSLEKVEIEGSGAYVSTSGTEVSGENNYVPPTIEAEEVRDLGGLQLIIGDHWSSGGTPEATTAEELALQKYREEVMEKYNFTVKQVAVAGWGDMEETYYNSVKAGEPVAHVFILDSSFVAKQMNEGLFYDLSTLEELDFTEDKWNQEMISYMSIDGGIYGMGTGLPELRYGLFWNKRLFEEAGLDPELPYTLQANGEWTWSKFKELCALLTRDTNGDGKTDVYAMANFSTDIVQALVASNETQLVTYENGDFVNNTGSAEVLEALNFAKELADAGYEMPQPEDSVWNWAWESFPEGAFAMQFNQGYQAGPAGRWYDMEDEIGFVCVPRPDDVEEYHTSYLDNITVIPSCYDAKTAADIAFAYNLWTNPAPGVVQKTLEETLAEEYAYLDERAVKETLPLLYQDGAGKYQYLTLVDGLSIYDISGAWPYQYVTPEEEAERIKERWDSAITCANEKKAYTKGETPETLTISIDSFQLLDSLDRTYLRTDGATGLLQWENACLFGTFSWSRELTETEMSYYHSGCLYDASGAEVDGCSMFAGTEVTDAQTGTTREIFGVEFPENLAAGTYTYELSISAAEESVTATCTFTIGTKETTYKYVITEDEDILITGMELNGATSVVIPSQIDGKTVEGINGWAFYDSSYSSLQELTLPATLKTIGHNAFYGCTALTELTIPASVTRLDADMFESRLDSSDAVAIKAVHVEKGNAYYCDVDGVLFKKDMKTLVYLPKDYDVTSYTVPAGVEAVERYTNDHIKTLSLPASLQSISAVNGEALEAFEVDAGNTVYSSIDGVLIKGNEVVAVPAGNSRTEYTVPAMVTSIGWSAFDGCSKLTSITIPESVTSIGSYAFQGCSALQSIVLPSTLDISSSNGYYMFSGCSSLKSIVLPQNITVIPTAMFWGCSALEEITLPGGVKTIEQAAFRRCTSLKEVVLPDGLETIESYAFMSCTNLEKVVIPASVNEIAADAFRESENVVIYTTEGSYAATYASEKEIPVRYQ